MDDGVGRSRFDHRKDLNVRVLEKFLVKMNEIEVKCQHIGIELTSDSAEIGEHPDHEEKSGYDLGCCRSDSDDVLFLGPEYVRSSEPIAEQNFTVPNMWSLSYVGLYTQYAAVGLLYGSAGTLLPFCAYVFDGPANLCSNSGSIFLFSWSFKLLFAIITECYHPFGMRRKPWMILGWIFVLILLFILAVFVQHMSAFTWLLFLLFMQAFMMFSDVPADGYSVELGKLGTFFLLEQQTLSLPLFPWFFC